MKKAEPSETMNSPFKFRVEGIGFNCGEPFEEWATGDIHEAYEKLDEYARKSPKIKHRLIQVISEIVPNTYG